MPTFYTLPGRADTLAAAQSRKYPENTRLTPEFSGIILDAARVDQAHADTRNDMTDKKTELLGRHRRTVRTAAGLTQGDVIQRVKDTGRSLSIDTLAAAEAGRSVSERSLRAVCIALECDLALYMTPGAPVVVD